jgi:hypothetical protein
MFYKIRHATALLLAVWTCWLASWKASVWAADKNKAPASENATSPSRRLYGQINAFGSACVSSGVTPLSTQLPTTVEDVKTGSPAYYAGVEKGDRILSASLETNRLALQIERQGKIYLVKMRAKTDPPSTRLASDASRFSLAEKLKAYRIKLIIDHSGSMYRSLGDSDKTRWQWVTEEVNRFCRQCEKLAATSFDLCLFAEDVQEYPGIKAAAVEKILAKNVTTGNTYLAPALKAALALTGADTRPYLIILVTDGQSVSSEENVDILVNALNRSSALSKSKVVFLQAGYSEQGTQFVAKLQSGLSAHGMKQATDMLLFEETSEKGILGAIEPLLHD